MAKRLTTGEALLEQVMDAQVLQAESVKDGPLLNYLLESKLDERRKLFKALTTRFALADAIDFSSNDVLSLSSSGALRQAWDIEMSRYPGAQLGSGGSRLLDGSHPYTEDLEAHIAAFHGAEEAMILNSGCECNVTIYGTLPAKDDVILHDELVHASIHDGMAISKCRNQFRFKHNDLVAFRASLVRLQNIGNLNECRSNLFISVESIYSMDGDVTPLAEMLEIAREVFPRGNFSFIIDEAHATGLLGKHGKGLVAMLGLEKEKEIAVRVHTFSKALASYGGMFECLGEENID
jgi:8-amino-7-oxononanoate synthase